MALGNLLDTAEGRAELRELISAVRQEDPDGEAARYRRLRQALRELLASQTPELRLLEAAAAVLPAGEAEPSGRCPGHLGAGESAGSHAGAGAPAR